MCSQSVSMPRWKFEITNVDAFDRKMIDNSERNLSKKNVFSTAVLNVTPRRKHNYRRETNVC